MGAWVGWWWRRQPAGTRRGGTTEPCGTWPPDTTSSLVPAQATTPTHTICCPLPGRGYWRPSTVRGGWASSAAMLPPAASPTARRRLLPCSSSVMVGVI